MEDHGASVVGCRRSIATWVAGTIAATLCIFPVGAEATRAYAIVDARILAGPGDDYPVVGLVNRGAAVDLNRCLPDYSWCNVSFGPDRGWVYGEQVTLAYRDNTLTGASYREVPEGFNGKIPSTGDATRTTDTTLDTSIYLDTLPEDLSSKRQR